MLYPAFSSQQLNLGASCPPSHPYFVRSPVSMGLNAAKWWPHVSRPVVFWDAFIPASSAWAFLTICFGKSPHEKNVSWDASPSHKSTPIPRLSRLKSCRPSTQIISNVGLILINTTKARCHPSLWQTPRRMLEMFKTSKARLQRPSFCQPQPILLFTRHGLPLCSVCMASWPFLISVECSMDSMAV